MITLYRVFLVLMAAIAAFMMPEAMGLPRDSQYTIGPGFLPLIMLGLTIVCCVILLLLDLREKSSATVKKESIPKMVLYILATGLLMGWKMTWGITSINAFVGTIVVYCLCCVLFNALGLRKKEIARNEQFAADNK